MKIKLFLFSLVISLSTFAKSLDYMLHIPENLKKNPSLVVVIHGCLQNSSLIAASTKWNELSRKEGFLVLYPDQKKDRHPLNCWNWYEKTNQKQGSGEPQEIVNLVQEIKKEFTINSKRVFLAGMSSGAGIVNILAACYPELWEGIGIHSGPLYASATNPIDAINVLKNGPQKTAGNCKPRGFKKKVIIFQGKQDKIVNPTHAFRIAQSYADSSSKKERKDNQGYSHYLYRRNKAKPIHLYLVEELGHEWSGGRKGIPFSNSISIDATLLMWNLFSS